MRTEAVRLLQRVAKKEAVHFYLSGSEALMAALVDCYPLAVLHQGLDRQKSGDAPLDIAAHILRSASPLSPPLVLATPALRLG